MARIAGVNIPTNKRVIIALTYIHGIGRTTAVQITDKLASITPNVCRIFLMKKFCVFVRRSTLITPWKATYVAIPR